MIWKPKREEIGLTEEYSQGLLSLQSAITIFNAGHAGKTGLCEMYQILTLQAKRGLLSTIDVEVMPGIYQAVDQ